jgi:Bacterial regulatory helix-turn-helix protein, lysR family
MIYAQAEEVMDMITAFGAHIRVTETGSFPAIVAKCDVSQPSVTRQIERLEQHFGVCPLHHTARRLSLTDDGRRALASPGRAGRGRRDGRIARMPAFFAGRVGARRCASRGPANAVVATGCIASLSLRFEPLMVGSQRPNATNGRLIDQEFRTPGATCRCHPGAPLFGFDEISDQSGDKRRFVFGEEVPGAINFHEACPLHVARQPKSVANRLKCIVCTPDNQRRNG